MKSYYVYKNWLVRLVFCVFFLFGTIILMGIEKTNKIPLFVYILFLSLILIFTLTMVILILINRDKFLTKIYLHDDFFEIKRKSNVLYKVKINEIKEIKFKKEDYVTFLIVEFYDNDIISTLEIEYNKNIALYFKKRKIDILK